MSVRARFWVQKITTQAISGGDVNRIVELAPVIRSVPTSEGGGTDKGNVDWAKYTPSGKIELTVNAEPAGQWFADRIGKDIAITFDDVNDAPQA